MPVGLLRRLVTWVGIILGVFVTALIVMNSFPNKYTTQPNFVPLTYSQEGDEVRLSVQNDRPQPVKYEQVWPQSLAATPPQPVKKLTFQPADSGTGSVPIQVPVDSPLTLQQHEIAYFILAPTLAEDDIKISFMINGVQTTETYPGLKP
jgi:hypothetical protein